MVSRVGVSLHPRSTPQDTGAFLAFADIVPDLVTAPSRWVEHPRRKRKTIFSSSIRGRTEGGSRRGGYKVVLKVFGPGVVRTSVGFGVRLFAHPPQKNVSVRFRNLSA